MKIFNKKIPDFLEWMLCLSSIICIYWLSFLFVSFLFVAIGPVMLGLSETGQMMFVCVIIFSIFCVGFTLRVFCMRLSKNLRRLNEEEKDRAQKKQDERLSQYFKK